MDDRLTKVLNIVINNTKDAKLKKTLEEVLKLNAEINYMDYNDWENYSNCESFESEMIDWFKEVEG